MKKIKESGSLSNRTGQKPVLKKVLVYSIPALLFLEVEADSEEDAREVTFRVCEGLRRLYESSHGVVPSRLAQEAVDAAGAFFVLAGTNEEKERGSNCLASNLALVGENTKICIPPTCSDNSPLM